jgi:hypothetical protein
MHLLVYMDDSTGCYKSEENIDLNYFLLCLPKNLNSESVRTFYSSVIYRAFLLILELVLSPCCSLR